MGNRVVSIGQGNVRPLLLAGTCLVALVLSQAVPQAAAAGKSFYAAPNGSGIACSQATPCEIGEAVTKAGDGDAVLLAGGSYELPFAGLTLDKAIDLGGAPGAPAILETTDIATLEVTAKADATLHDLRLVGEGQLQLGSGTADRVFVAFAGVGNDACELDKGTTLRNSVCWTTEAREEDEGVSHAIDIVSFLENQDELVVLRNVTAIADTETGNAIHLLGTSGAELTVNAANVVARSANGIDVAAEIDGGGFPKAHLNITNSSFGEFQDLAPNPDAYVTPLGTFGNIAAAPTFIDPANGNFRVGADSPTLDGGVADLLTGVSDLDGNDRAQAGCFGAEPVPDMGAYERSPSAACPPKPPPPPPPVEPRKPVFRVVNLFLNKKTGTGRLLVEVPEGGGTLSLTGSGVKLVRRTAATSGGVITLPILTWAITKVRLAKIGKTRVRLKVIFESRLGGVEEWSKGIQLRKSIRKRKKNS
jgi:hypothetical protein